MQIYTFPSRFVPFRKVPIPTQVLVLYETERNERNLIDLNKTFQEFISDNRFTLHDCLIPRVTSYILAIIHFPQFNGNDFNDCQATILDFVMD